MKLPLPRYNPKKNTARVPISFLEKVANFDFDKYYTPKVRIACHTSMWIIFTFLIQINLLLDYDLPLPVTLAFTARSMICNMTVFYVFFYIVVPETLFKNRIVGTILSLPLCLVIWIILNHYCIVLIGQHLRVESPYLKPGIASNLKQRFVDVISPKNILVLLIAFFYSISTFFFIKIVFDIIRFYSRLFKTERKASQLEIEKQQLETAFLKAQLNPHFLFNTLNNLYGLSLRNDSQTPQTIMQLSTMMRYTLYECNTEMVLLSREIEFLKNYVSLEKMRYKADKEIIFNIEDSQVNQQKITPLLNFTFIENGFKYGLKNKNKGFLKIDMCFLDNNFYFSIINDKEDKPVAEKKFSGIGISNIRKRLELLYADKYELITEDRGTSYFVSLKINLG